MRTSRSSCTILTKQLNDSGTGISELVSDAAVVGSPWLGTMKGESIAKICRKMGQQKESVMRRKGTATLKDYLAATAARFPIEITKEMLIDYLYSFTRRDYLYLFTRSHTGLLPSRSKNQC